MGNESLNLVGRCGMYCGACDIYRAYRDDGKKLLNLAKSLGCAPGVLRCEGCQADTPARWGSDCAIITCQERRGLTYCYQCEEYAAETCEEFAKIHSEYAAVGVDLRQNLVMIQADRAEEWFADQNRQWRCGSAPAVGGRLRPARRVWPKPDRATERSIQPTRLV